jgi:pimeloyl-ACP methyl ester carboxylesterase
MTQNGQEFLLTFEKGLKEIQEPKRPQNPIAPLPYQEKLVVYDNIKAGITISGTLTLPPSQGPFPAVLLIAGSGPHDRNEEIFGHKPFLVLADHLTRNGIAALRVDKRGCGKSTGDYKTATSLDFSEDVEAGIAYLKSLPDINPCQIGLIGHSEGGMIAPMVASKSPDVAFLVLAAGPAATGEEILYQQNALILKASGESEETIEELNSFRKQIFAILKKESDFEIANNQLQEMAQNYLSLPQEEQKAHVIALLNSAPKLFTPWFRYFLSFDPSTVLKQIKVPVLAINGELDLQVPSKQNLPIIDAALKAAGNTDFTTLELPKLNHLFQTCQTGHFGEYQTLEETISPSALQIISDWILERVTN